VRVRFAPARAGEVRRSCLDPSRAARRLGWRPRRSLPEGLDETLASTVAAYSLAQ
jgi:UDP-glucose 4-epimerase